VAEISDHESFDRLLLVESWGITSMTKENITGVILSGGKNRRMGTNKAFLNINGTKIIERTVGLLKDIFSEVLIVTNVPLSYLHLKATLVTDILADKGPLGGLYSALFFASHSRVFVCACDMPFLQRNFIEYMVQQPPTYDIIVPDAGDGLQPLHAIYAKSCLPTVRNALEQNKLKMTGFYKGFNVLVIPEGVVNTYDPSKKMFLNVNTGDDLKQLSGLYEV